MDEPRPDDEVTPEDLELEGDGSEEIVGGITTRKAGSGQHEY